MSKYDRLSKEELIRIIETLEKEIKHPQYGLVWENEREPEKIVSVCINHLPVLKRIKSKEIKTDDSEDNILIEGDNYHALTVLNYTHKEKIDVIYIDPPYNTGKANEWKYNDKYINKEDGYRHSKWLNFMEKRLKLAKELLKDDGVIFVSIDDHEFAQLKLLMDQIFGENNFVNTLIFKRATKNLNNQFKRVKSLNQAFEYVLVYRKTDAFYYKNAYKETSSKRKEGYWTSFYNNADRPTMRYEIEGINIDKGQWKWEKQRAFRALNNYKTYLKNYRNQYSLKEYWERYKDEYELKTGFKLEFLRKNNNSIQYWVLPKDKTLMDTNLMDYYINDNAGKSKYKFDTVKNLNAIKKLISIVSTKDELILDFFAGSGTTGHAVLELNKEDGGNRKFILVTNNEGNIATEICYPRLKNVMKGYRKNGSGEWVEGLGGNLRYFKTDFIKKTKNKNRVMTSFIRKATDTLCAKENIYNLEKEGPDYKIFSSNKKDKFLCIYYNFTGDGFEAFLEELKKLNGKKIIYMFDIPKGTGKSLFPERDDVEVKPVPRELSEAYNRLLKNGY